METGQKTFARGKLNEPRLTATRFTFESDFTAKAARAGWRIYEVPISYSGRTYAEGRRLDGETLLSLFGQLHIADSLIDTASDTEIRTAEISNGQTEDAIRQVAIYIACFDAAPA